MRTKTIKDTFEALSPSEVQKEKIYRAMEARSANVCGTKKMKHRVILAAALTVCFIAAITLLLNSGLLSGNRQAPGQTGARFKGFLLTAYAAPDGQYLTANHQEEAEKSVLTPNVKVLLAKYSLVMSSVPGLPFTVGMAEDEETAYTLTVSVSDGEIITWDTRTGAISSKGKTFTLAAGTTIYWSPIVSGDEGSGSVQAYNTTVTVEAVLNGVVVARQQIEIRMDESFYYSATAGELELF